MAFAIDRLNGQNFADNIVNSALYFDAGTWTVVQGTGNVTLDANEALSGNRSLKITSTTPSTDVLVSNAVQDTEIVLSGDYQLTWFAKKNIAQELRGGTVLIFQNGSPLDTQSFEIGSTVAEDDINDTWVRFQTDTNYNFTKGDVITFQFGLSAATTSQTSTFINFDGVMLNKADRNNGIAPSYIYPISSINTSGIVPDVSELGFESYLGFAAKPLRPSGINVTAPFVTTSTTPQLVHTFTFTNEIDMALEFHVGLRYNIDVVNRDAIFRFDTDGETGIDINQEAKDATNNSFSTLINVDVIPAGTHNIEFFASVEAGSGTTTLEISGYVITARRVKNFSLT